MPYCDEVIISDSEKRGSGKDEGSPVRRITQIFTKDGVCIGEDDSMGNFTIEDMIAFAEWCTSQQTLPKPTYEALNLWLAQKGAKL